MHSLQVRFLAASVALLTLGACSGTLGSSSSQGELLGNNLLDANTEGMESNLGHWQAWYSTRISRSPAQAQTGKASLGIAVTAPNGWGVQLDNWPGFSADGGPKQLSFWARSGSSKSQDVTLTVQWRSGSAVLRTDTVPLSSVGASWTQGLANVSAPTGTKYVWVLLTGSRGASGDQIFVDEVRVAEASAPPADAGTKPDAGTAPDAGTRSDGGQAPDAGTTPPPPPPDGGVIVVGVPTSPPATICGNGTYLDGPTRAPSGAVAVSISDDLSSLVQSHAAGTTFYLSAGTHTLPDGAYSQVIPKDNDVFVGAPGAILDGRHDNDYAFTGGASHVVIRYLTVQGFGAAGGNNNEGVVNHDAGANWLIEYSTVTHNAGAGVFLGSGSTVRYSCLASNGQYGFSAYAPDGITNVTLDHNEISGNNTDDWETREPGCGCTGGGKFWATRGAVVSNNYVHDNKSIGLWADTNNAGFQILGNYISDNDGDGIIYEISYNAVIQGNNFIRNGNKSGPTNPGFPTGAIYLSESGGDARAYPSFSTLDVSHNAFTDNWGGVVLWENADRYCNSPANTSSDACTVGGAATLKTCVAGTINGAPYYSDCRWKTQNVAVHDNTFSLTAANIAGCTKTATCGFQGLFSNWGSYPSWSPYMGEVVEEAITFHQNNVFRHNTYRGPWFFMAHDQGITLSFAQWQAAPYAQDTGSTLQ